MVLFIRLDSSAPSTAWAPFHSQKANAVFTEATHATPGLAIAPAGLERLGGLPGFVNEGARFCVLHHDKPTLGIRRLVRWLVEQGAASADSVSSLLTAGQPRQPERG